MRHGTLVEDAWEREEEALRAAIEVRSALGHCLDGAQIWGTACRRVA